MPMYNANSNILRLKIFLKKSFLSNQVTEGPIISIKNSINELPRNLRLKI